MILHCTKVLCRLPELWHMISTAIRLGTGLLILPVALRVLMPEEMGLWYLLTSLVSLSVLAEMGLSQSVLRYVAAVQSGLGHTEAHDPAWGDREIFFQANLADMARSLRLIYSVIAAITGLIFVASVTFYLRSPDIRSVALENLPAVVIVVISCVWQNYDRWMPAYLNGLGKIEEMARASFWSALIYLLVTLLGFFAGLGLLALALGNLLQPLYLRLLCAKMIRHELSGLSPGGVSPLSIFALMWPTTWRQGLVGSGAYFINYSNTLVISAFLGLVDTASYGLTNQVINLLIGVAYMFVQTRTPQMVQHRISGDLASVRRIFARQLCWALLLYVVGGALLLLLGPTLLRIIGSRSDLLPADLLLFFLGYRLLEFHHSAFAMLVTTQNKVPFVKASLCSALCIIGLSILLVRPLGLWGVMLATASVQLAYNNWYPVLLGCRSLSCNLFQVYQAGAKEIFQSLRHLRHA